MEGWQLSSEASAVPREGPAFSSQWHLNASWGCPLPGAQGRCCQSVQTLLAWMGQQSDSVWGSFLCSCLLRLLEGMPLPMTTIQSPDGERRQHECHYAGSWNRAILCVCCCSGCENGKHNSELETQLWWAFTGWREPLGAGVCVVQVSPTQRGPIKTEGPNWIMPINFRTRPYNAFK